MNTLDDATPEQIANMLTAPVVKLYKRCARGKHDTCPGSFEAWSICSCDCHAGISDTRPAPVSCADKAEAIAEAIAIVTPKATGAVNFGFKGTHRVGDAANSDATRRFNAMTGKTNQLLRWTEQFHMCATCARDFAKTFANMDAGAKSTFAAGRVADCADCNAATKQAMREYALSPAYARICATKVLNANYGTDHLKPVYLKGGE